eukprot:6177964-Pleurochrysis_carterae.AAC.1
MAFYLKNEFAIHALLTIHLPASTQWSRRMGKHHRAYKRLFTYLFSDGVYSLRILKLIKVAPFTSKPKDVPSVDSLVLMYNANEESKQFVVH